MKVGCTAIILKRKCRQWKTKGFSCPKKACQSKSYVKVMIIVFFFLDSESIVRLEFIPNGNNCKLQKSQGFARRCTKKHTKKCANCFLLHHDNAPCQALLLTHEPQKHCCLSTSTLLPKFSTV